MVAVVAGILAQSCTGQLSSRLPPAAPCVPALASCDCHRNGRGGHGVGRPPHRLNHGTSGGRAACTIAHRVGTESQLRSASNARRQASAARCVAAAPWPVVDRAARPAHHLRNRPGRPVHRPGRRPAWASTNATGRLVAAQVLNCLVVWNTTYIDDALTHVAAVDAGKRLSQRRARPGSEVRVSSVLRLRSDRDRLHRSRRGSVGDVGDQDRPTGSG